MQQAVVEQATDKGHFVRVVAEQTATQQSIAAAEQQGSKPQAVTQLSKMVGVTFQQSATSKIEIQQSTWAAKAGIQTQFTGAQAAQLASAQLASGQ